MDSEKTMKPQFDRTRHGSLFDRGRADAYYGRIRTPHWCPDGNKFNPETNLTAEEITEYHAGYDAGEKRGTKKCY
jgi:hypothetical protein